ncbi:MAG TPA: nucleotidyltransferase domain-containing protein [Rhabdochlamydiaceae bacterium]|nr:nucleotidyltransferase domain-containing protein [Rhabdochlamydiaceae bacterium]
MEPKINIPRNWVETFCKTNHIIKLALFGSVLTNHFSDKSDIDILVEFDQQHIPGLFRFVEIKEELAASLGREVDLRTPEDISKLFREEVLKHSYLIYGQEGFKSS